MAVEGVEWVAGGGGCRGGGGGGGGGREGWPMVAESGERRKGGMDA